MKRGFTMVELLAVIVILAVISLISTTAIMNIQKETNENNQDVLNTIYMAAESYIMRNYSNYKVLDNVGATTNISVVTLINNNYLKNTIINPNTNNRFNSNDYVLVTRNSDMTFSFEIVSE